MTQPINTITTMRLPDGQQVAFIDWSDRPLFSTCDILNGASDERIPLFNYVVGDAVSGTQNITTKRTASDRDTNISTPGAMASTEELMIYAIKPEVMALAVPMYEGEPVPDATRATETYNFDPIPAAWQLAYFQRLMLLEVRVSQKTMQQVPFGYLNTGFGVSFAGQSNGIQGWPSQSSVRALSVPIHIGGQEKYEVALVNPSGSDLNIGLSDNSATPSDEQTNRLFQVRVVLDGLYKRPVA
jgi:hypothetical protein